VLPGFIATEGFPAAELLAKATTRWMVSTPEKAAQAIFETGIARSPERWVPRPYAIAGALRAIAPGLTRMILGAGSAQVLTTATGADAASSRNGAGTPTPG
jgi:hypothetical protein